MEDGALTGVGTEEKVAPESLHRKGLPGLVELHEVKKVSARTKLVSQLHLPIDFKSCGNLKVLELDRFITNSAVPKLTIGKITTAISEFI